MTVVHTCTATIYTDNGLNIAHIVNVIHITWQQNINVNCVAVHCYNLYNFYNYDEILLSVQPSNLSVINVSVGPSQMRFN